MLAQINARRLCVIGDYEIGLDDADIAEVIDAAIALPIVGWSTLLGADHGL